MTNANAQDISTQGPDANRPRPSPPEPEMLKAKQMKRAEKRMRRETYGTKHDRQRKWYNG